MKLKLVLVGHFTQWLMTDGPDCVVSQITHIIELAPTIPCSIFAPTRHIELPPRAITSAGRRDHDAVATVGKKCDRWNCSGIKVWRSHLDGFSRFHSIEYSQS